jgi:hypothetical protein
MSEKNYRCKSYTPHRRRGAGLRSGSMVTLYFCNTHASNHRWQVSDDNAAIESFQNIPVLDDDTRGTVRGTAASLRENIASLTAVLAFAAGLLAPAAAMADQGSVGSPLIGFRTKRLGRDVRTKLRFAASVVAALGAAIMRWRGARCGYERRWRRPRS